GKQKFIALRTEHSLRAVGVQIPDLDETLASLLFADDLAIVVDSVAMLVLATDIVTSWANKWEAAVGITKCGVIVPNCIRLRDEVIAAINGSQIKIQEQVPPHVEEYEYLGILVTGCRFGGLRSHYGFTDSQIYNTLEEARTFLKITINPSQSTKAYAVRTELGVTTFQEIVIRSRARILAKYPTLKTWAAKVVAAPELKVQKSQFHKTKIWLQVYAKTNATSNGVQEKIVLFFRKQAAESKNPLVALLPNTIDLKSKTIVILGGNLKNNPNPWLPDKWAGKGGKVIPGYSLIVRFLGEVMPKNMAKLWKNAIN
ncbi:hypothetical protein F5876DRAFT_69208, partial [Lentinula aff. lateritia]